MTESLPINVFVTERGKRAGVTVPKKANPTDSGHDIKAPYGFWLWPSVFGCKKMWTGLDVDIPLETFTINGLPFGIDMEIEGRTSRQLKHVEPGPKIFDRTYRVKKGDPKGIVIGMKNMSWLPYRVQKHEKVAQLIFRPFLRANMVEVAHQDEIRRGTEAGFRGDQRFGESDSRGE
jgi:dUTPase